MVCSCLQFPGYLIPSEARDLAGVTRNVVRYVYIMASQSRVLYTGSTADLLRRVYEHKVGLIPGFTLAYRVNRLGYFDWTDHIRAAIEREWEIKGWRRAKKVVLIESRNPGWLDLAIDWFPDITRQGPSLRSG